MNSLNELTEEPHRAQTLTQEPTTTRPARTTGRSSHAHLNHGEQATRSQRQYSCGRRRRPSVLAQRRLSPAVSSSRCHRAWDILAAAAVSLGRPHSAAHARPWLPSISITLLAPSPARRGGCPHAPPPTNSQLELVFILPTRFVSSRSKSGTLTYLAALTPGAPT